MDRVHVSNESLIVYSHVGTCSVPIGRYSAEGTLRLRDDLRQPHGLLAAPLGILILDCISKNTHTLATSPPIRIDIHVFDQAIDVTDLRVRGRVLRHGRTQIISEARIEEATNEARVVAFGTVGMSVTGPPVDDYSGSGVFQTQSETERKPAPPLTEVFGGQPKDDCTFEIPVLTPRIGNHRLHSGVMQVLAEAAAMKAVSQQMGTMEMWTEDLGIAIMTSGRNAPFSIVPEILTIRGGSAGCRVEILDADDHLIAVVSIRFRLLLD